METSRHGRQAHANSEAARKQERARTADSLDDDLTEALEATFPASDPLAMTQPHSSPFRSRAKKIEKR
jgi:hypothetical protein